jgi:hypothetical protein
VDIGTIPAPAPAPVTAPTLRRSARLAAPAPAPAPSSKNVAAAAIGREAYRLYPDGCRVPDVADKELFDRLLHLTGFVMERIFLTADNGRYPRSLTKKEAIAWLRYERVLLTMGMVRSWMHVPLGEWRLHTWTEEQVEIAMRQYAPFMTELAVTMKYVRF